MMLDANRKNKCRKCTKSGKEVEIMKETKLNRPVNCETLSEEQSKEVCGGAGLTIAALCVTITGLVWTQGYPAAGRYAKKVWPNGIPKAAKVALMAAFPDPIGWYNFEKAYKKA